MKSRRQSAGDRPGRSPQPAAPRAASARQIMERFEEDFPKTPFLRRFALPEGVAVINGRIRQDESAQILVLDGTATVDYSGRNAKLQREEERDSRSNAPRRLFRPVTRTARWTALQSRARAPVGAIHCQAKSLELRSCLSAWSAEWTWQYLAGYGLGKWRCGVRRVQPMQMRGRLHLLQWLLSAH